MPTSQCLGTTKEGTRCLKKVSDGQWCHYHKSQSKSGPTIRATGTGTVLSPSKLAKPEQILKASSSQLNNHKSFSTAEYSNKGGYIYVYTLASFFSTKHNEGWIQTRNLTKDKHVNKWVDLDMKKLDVLLIKVGMTTKSPAIRIRQWEDKCHHKLTHLYPHSHSFKKFSLSEAFRGLSIGSSKANFRSYESSARGFYNSKNALRAEKLIHDALRGKYGRGQIQCTGCVLKKELAPSSKWPLILKGRNESNPHNIHTEWFPVPRREIEDIFKIIDYICTATVA